MGLMNTSSVNSTKAQSERSDPLGTELLPQAWCGFVHQDLSIYRAWPEQPSRQGWHQGGHSGSSLCWGKSNKISEALFLHPGTPSASQPPRASVSLHEKIHFSFLQHIDGYQLANLSMHTQIYIHTHNYSGISKNTWLSCRIYTPPYRHA